jgi:cell division protein FtsB
MANDELHPRSHTRVGTDRLARKGHGTVFYVLVFATAVLVLNVIFGDKGVLATSRVRREHDQLAAEVARAKAENAALAEEARKLAGDPATIEGLARDELGLIRRGEKIFYIRDLPPTPQPRRRP